MYRFKNQKFIMLSSLILLVTLLLFGYFRNNSNISIDIQNIILILILLVIVYETRKKGSVDITQIKQANDSVPDTPITASTSNVSFKDIAGIDDVKLELEEVVWFLKDPTKFERLGIRMPRGILLVGPPGVGKTMIAKAVASEANVPFFYQSGASFVHIYVGMGAKRVRELFTEARRSAPSIIFIDEIDAVGKSRGGSRNDEREATLNQLLTEMDGFEESTQIVVIAATNKIEMLDSALLRPGRFDRRIFVPLPTFEERVEIAVSYLSKIEHDVKPEDIASISVGFSPAMISALINEAAIQAFRQNTKSVDMSHFEAVKDRVLLGKKRVQIFTKDQKEYQALYQSSRAVCACWFGLDFQKVSLLSDDIKIKEMSLMSKNELSSHLKVLLCGMAVSEIYYGEHFSNVKEDIQKARTLADEMVNELAMGEHIIASKYETTHLIEESYKEIKKFLTGVRPSIDLVVKELIEIESIDRKLIKKYLDEVF